MSQAVRLAAAEAKSAAQQLQIDGLLAAAAANPPAQQQDPEIGNLQNAMGSVLRQQQYATRRLACDTAVRDAVLSTGNGDEGLANTNIGLVKIFYRFMYAWLLCSEWWTPEDAEDVELKQSSLDDMLVGLRCLAIQIAANHKAAKSTAVDPTLRPALACLIADDHRAIAVAGPAAPAATAAATIAAMFQLNSTTVADAEKTIKQQQPKGPPKDKARVADEAWKPNQQGDFKRNHWRDNKRY